MSAYLGLLQALTGPLGGASPIPRDGSSGAKGPGKETVPHIPIAAPNLALEFFHWDGFQQDVSVGPRAGGAAFEAAQMLLSLALWKAATAARAVNKPAVNSAQSAEAYRLMREAAGIAEELKKEPFKVGNDSADISS